MEPPALPPRRSAWMGPLALVALGLAGMVAWLMVSARRPAAGPAATVAAAPTGTASAAEGAKPAGNAMVALASQLMASPALRSVTVSRLRPVLEKQYGDAMDELRFTPDQRDRFLTLLIEAQLESVETTLKILAGNLTPAEREAIQRDVAAANAATQAKVEAFFAREFPGDPTKLAAFRRALEDEPVRSVVNGLKAQLAGSADALAPEKSVALSAAMQEERAKFRFSPEAWEPSDDLAAALKADIMAIRARELAQLNEQIEARAAIILNPAQLAALRRVQAEQVEALQRASALSRQLVSP